MVKKPRGPTTTIPACSPQKPTLPRTVTDASGTRAFDCYESCENLQGMSARLSSESSPAGFFVSRMLNYGYQYSVAGRRNGTVASVQYGSGV